METIEIALWIAGLLLVFAIATFLIKRFTKAQTYYLFSLIRTTRFLPLLDRFSKRKRILNAFADIGLVLGFGAIAIDFMIGRKLTRKMRIAVFVASAFLLFEFFNFAFQALLSNPFIEKYNFFLSLGFAVMGFAGFLVVSLAAYSEFVISSVLLGEKTCPGVAPLIPGVSIPNFPITIPLHGWISILIILIVHEGMHGILMKKAKIAVKSTGVLFAGFLPIGAFVEPWEEIKETGKETEEQLIAIRASNKELEKHKKRTGEIESSKSPVREQLRVFSAGPTANLFSMIAVFLFSLLLFSFILAPVFGNWAEQEYTKVVSGIVVARVDQNIELCRKISESPAFGKLEVGMAITQINGFDVNSAKDFSRELQKAGKNPYELTILTKDTNEEKKVLITPDKMGFHGYKVGEKTREGIDFSREYKTFSLILNSTSDFLYWLLILSFIIGLANFLPLEPFDGGKIAKIVILPYFGFVKKSNEEKKKIIEKIFFWFIITLLFLNALPFFL